LTLSSLGIIFYNFSHLHNFIIQKYVEKRKKEGNLMKEGHQYITPRTLLAIIRLSQALARLRFNEEVEQVDVDEAMRLIEASRSQINLEDGDRPEYPQRRDAIGNVFLVLRDMCSHLKDKTIKISDLQKKIISRNLTEKDMRLCLEEYSNLNVLYVNEKKNEVTLI
jgi:DNA replication licensing factor MCM7